MCKQEYDEAVSLVLDCEELHCGAVTSPDVLLDGEYGVKFFDDYSGVHREFYDLDLLRDFIDRVKMRD